MALCQHYDDLGGHGITIEIKYGGTLLSAVRRYGMGVIPNMALDMCRSLHLIILYLLKNEQGNLESRMDAWLNVVLLCYIQFSRYSFVL